jgi:hypothetical protein
MKNVHLIPTDKLSRLGRFVDTGNLFLRTPNDLPRGENVNVYITDDSKIREGYYLDLTHNIVMKSVFYPSSDKNCKKIIITTDPELIKDGVQEIPNDFLEWLVKSPSCQYGGYKDIAWDKIITLKEKPKQYPIGGYAPGFYSCECITCKTEFMGDKLAIQCEPCAIKTTQEEPKKDYSGLHLRHCYQGEYKDGCKYGKDDCPAKPLEPKQETIEEVAVKYVRNEHDNTLKLISKYSFKDGAKSDAARDYWFSQFQKQDKTKFSEEDMQEYAEFCIRCYNEGLPLIVAQDWSKQFKKKLI